MQLVRDVQELLQELMLLLLSYFILLGPSLVKLFIKSSYLVLLLCNQMIDLNLDAVASLLQELSSLLLRQLFHCFSHTSDLRVVFLFDEVKTNLFKVKYIG